MNYIGEICPVCSKTFTADDDIVVCPDCGTPHHRECYKIENKCANSDFHGTGKKWVSANKKSATFRICPVCRFPNTPEDVNCQRCGSELEESADVQQDGSEEAREQLRDAFASVSGEELLDPLKYLGFDPKEDMGGATMKDVSDFVGPSTIYYLPKFKQMKDNGVRPTFNLFSLIVPTLFFANRKMWGWAIVAAVLGIIFNFPASLLLSINEYPEDIAGFISDNKSFFQTISDVFFIADMGIRVLSCLFANWLYFRFVMRSVKRLKRNGGQSERFKAAGGIKPLNLVFITLIKYGIGVVAIMTFFVVFRTITTINDFSLICLLLK